MEKHLYKDVIRVANISGFYGDRFSAMQEMLKGGEVDFLTGDYLAELTMAILYKSKMKNANHGFALTFLQQIQHVMAECLDRRVKVIANAGGLNPSSLAKSLQELATKLQLSPVIAFIEGDDLMPRLSDIPLKHTDSGVVMQDSGMLPLSANAYLGCWGIVEALRQGADIVVTGRVADTSLVMAPAAYAFDWHRNDWDALASAAVAGHVIECSGQAVGGNYSFVDEIDSYHNMGFPFADIHRDGSVVISKHQGTGGNITIGTVTSQLMYEIQSPAYITPDVVAHFDTIELNQLALNQVSITGVKGSAATDSAKVTANCMGGFHNTMTLYLTGLDIQKKVSILKELFVKNVGGTDIFEKLTIEFFENKNPEPRCNEEAFSTLRFSVIDKDPDKAGKLFTSKMVELALCAPPGWCMANAPGAATPRIVHFPSLVDKHLLTQRVFVNDHIIEVNETYGYKSDYIDKRQQVNPNFGKDHALQWACIGELYAARSGDKGGNANLGIWAKSIDSFAYLSEWLTIEKFKELLPETDSFEVERHVFSNVLGLNFYIRGFLEDGVAANAKMDGQAKTLGEFLRTKKIPIPSHLLLNAIDRK